MDTLNKCLKTLCQNPFRIKEQMDIFPSEIIEEILLNLRYNDRISVSRVCKLWYIFVNKHRKRLFYGINKNNVIYVMNDIFDIINEFKSSLQIQKVCLSSNKDRMIVLGRGERNIEIICLTSGEIISSFILSSVCKKIFWTYDDSMFVVYTCNSQLLFYELYSSKIIKTLDNCISVAHNSRRDKMAYLSTEGYFVIYDFYNKNNPAIVITYTKEFYCRKVAFSKDDHYIIVSLTLLIQIYDINGVLVNELKGYNIYGSDYDYIHSKNILITPNLICSLLNPESAYNEKINNFFRFLLIYKFVRYREDLIIAQCKNQINLISLSDLIISNVTSQLSKFKIISWCVSEQYIYILTKNNNKENKGEVNHRYKYIQIINLSELNIVQQISNPLEIVKIIF